MNRITGLLIAAALLCSLPSYALDGVVISSLSGGGSYRGEFSPGTLVRHDLQNNYVVRVDSLRIHNAASPRINMSGTYFAYIKQGAGQYGRTLVIRAMDGAAQTREFPLENGAVWLWWTADGSMFYTVNVQGDPNLKGQSKVRKITFSKDASNQLVVKDIFWAKLDCQIQGGFVGMSMIGQKIGYSSGETQRQSCAGQADCPYGITGGWTMPGDTTKWLTTPDQGGSGCGWSVSPSGDRFANWIGGHNVSSWLAWGNAPCSDCGAVTFTDLNKTWAVYRDSDPESKLEYRVAGTTTWNKDPIGVCGADNVWSVNSENWCMVEIGAYWIDYGADCYNMIALSLTHKKAINVTKIMPWKKNPARWGSTDHEVRGISFPDTTHGQLSADRGILWCSNVDDVYEPLKHFVQDRQTDNLYWSNLLGLPPAQIGSAPTSAPRISTTSSRVRVLNKQSATTVRMPSSARFIVDIVDASGRTVTTMSGQGNAVDVPALKAGCYVVKVRQRGQTYCERIAAN